MNFLVDADGKPKTTIVPPNLHENATEHFETAVSSADITKRLIKLFCYSKYCCFLFC